MAASATGFNPTPYSLSLLVEYTHTLDSLPLDLSRNFADLRELDAVLSSSMASITNKIYALTDLIERGSIERDERLWLLGEIADEAARLKLGGEDKIRVASQAADNLKSHASHLRTLVELLPDFDASTLARKTTYPHVAPRSFMPVSSFETGRRRPRPNAGSLLNASVADHSPVKRRRPRDDDSEVVSKSPRKDRAGEGGRSRNNTRRRPERALSPSESLVSVTSHIPQGSNPNTSNNPRGSNNVNHSRSNGALSSNATAANKQRAGGLSNPSNRAKHAASHHSSHTPNPGDNVYRASRDGVSPPVSLVGMNGSSNRRGASAAVASNSGGASRNNQYGGTASLSSAASGYGGGGGGAAGRQGQSAHALSGSQVAHNPHGHAYMGNGTHYVGDPLAPGWTPPNAHQLEGPGMPVQRNGNGAALGMHQGDGRGAVGAGGTGSGLMGSAGVGTAGDAGDLMDPDEDEQYCFCRNVSFGEMIACDDDSCEIEWFHLACIGLTTIPQGQWYCEACSKKRNAHRPSRGGRRKNANARSAKAS